jgi:hypothetical protein
MQQSDMTGEAAYNMKVLDSARRHGISDSDMLTVIANPYVIAELQEDPEKLLFLGFDTKTRAIEVITDTGSSGQVFVIHANLITPKYEKLLAEVLR